MSEKVWSNEEIRTMWPQAAGELKGFQRSLEVRAGLTAAQLGMAIQLAEIGFKATCSTGDKPTDTNEPVTIETLDETEAALDYIISQANSGRDMHGVMIRLPIFDKLHSILKQAREAAGRPEPKLK